MTQREQVLLELGRSPVLAHATLFAEHHQNETPPFHVESLAAWHSPAPRIGEMAFRGAAKSTRAEEAIAVMAWFRRFKNCVLLGETEARAVERLRSIKRHVEQNEYAAWLFETGPGDIWTEAKVTLTNGCMIQAYGRGQSLRGVKHLDARPDLIFMDDLEDKESVATPEAREKTLVWYVSTVVPALDPAGRMRMAATPLHPEALAVKLAASGSWVFKTYPIIKKALHDTSQGDWEATWPQRYPVEAALRIQAEMAEVGKSEEFDQEYLCVARNPATQVFTPDMIVVRPQVRSWHAVYAMYDPARTTNKNSATTGKVVWSWIGSRLVIWDACARKWMPDEIVKDIFDVDREYNPVAIGVEETGLNEFLLQPLRSSQVQRGVTLPLRPLHAPRGKLDFIRALQPYFRAGEVEFARELPELRQQLLGFPTGLIDAPNALAYALKMRLGVPVYENFRAEHVVGEIPIPHASNLWLAVHTDGRTTTAALCQMHRGRLAILADWLAEGGPGDALPDIVAEANLLGGKTTPKLIAPPSHFGDYDIIGLRAASRRSQAGLSRGGDPANGREEIRALLARQAHGGPSLAVASQARWTLRAFAGGFARNVDQVEPIEGPYRVLMEGVESFAAMLRGAGVDTPRNIAYTPSGKPYTSARAV